MLHKTLLGFFLGLVISASIALNINLILPLKVDTLLLIGLIISFPIWAGIQVWCYSSTSNKQAWLRLTKVLVPSVVLNIILLYVR